MDENRGGCERSFPSFLLRQPICYPTALEMFKILCYNDVCKQRHKRQIAMETIEEIRRHDRNL